MIKQAFALMLYARFLSELALGYLCYRLTDVPPQSTPDTVFGAGRDQSKTGLMGMEPMNGKTFKG